MATLCLPPAILCQPLRAEPPKRQQKTAEDRWLDLFAVLFSFSACGSNIPKRIPQKNREKNFLRKKLPSLQKVQSRHHAGWKDYEEFSTENS